MSVEKPENGPPTEHRARPLQILAVPFLISLNMLLTAYLAQVGKDHGFDLTRLLNNQPQAKDYIPAVLKPPETTDEQVRMAEGFIDIKLGLESILNQQLSLADPSEERLSDSASTVSFLQKRGRQHLINGVALAKISLPLEEAATISQLKDSLVIEGDVYSLGDLYDRSLAGAILELKFSRMLTTYGIQQRQKEDEERAKRWGVPVEEVRRYSSWQDNRPQINSQIEILEWLKSKNIDITIDENAWVFLPRQYLAYLGRTMKALEDNYLPTSVRIRLVRHEKGMGGGQYDGHDWPAPFTIRVTNRSTPWAIPHEVGHFLSDAAYLPNQYWANKMRSFSQTAFTEYVWPNEGRDPYESGNKEAYAEAVARYLFDGIGFRRHNLRSLASESEFEADKRQYEFVKGMFQGREFVPEGIPLIPSEIYKPGTMVRITNPDQDRPGILLRPTLSLNELEVIRPDLPAVFNDDVVELLEKQTLGGFFSRDGYVSTHDERTFWQVRVSGQGYFGESQVGYLDRNTIGWIEEKWLGEPYSRR